MDEASTVTVVIPTRNRGDSVVQTIRTILLNDYASFEVKVVDQSEDNRTENALGPLLTNPHIAYIRTSTRGLSAALNLGISHAQSEIIAITGDDCEVDANWIKESAAAFNVDRQIGIVFGNILAAPHDMKVGFVPAYVRDDEFLARGISEKHHVGGTSACMALRRSVWTALGGFDQMLGVGSSLHSAEDTDLTLRALFNGYAIYETPRMVVTHYGFYKRDECNKIVHRYWYGTGAAFVKQLKCGRWSVITVLLRLARGWALRKSRMAVSLDRRSHRVLQLGAFARGFMAGAIRSVDRIRGHYIPSIGDL